MPRLARFVAWLTVVVAGFLLVRAVGVIFFPLTAPEPTSTSIGEIFARRLVLAAAAALLAAALVVRTHRRPTKA